MKRDMKPRTPVSAKKPYRSPRLVAHGDLRRLTMAKGGNKKDGGGNPKTRA